uniref:Uncharacterized protein n=1 Tax=Rhizophora mucronata TaxID=61149 RepID=A0A2P2J0E5_RHIMU
MGSLVFDGGDEKK